LQRHFDDAGLAIECTPLALNPHDLVIDLERQVVALMLNDRAQNGDTELRRRSGDLRFRYRALRI
jgi:hypothetical protein